MATREDPAQVDIRTRIAKSPQLSRLERSTAITTSPNSSIFRLAGSKIRVLAEYVARSCTETKGPRGWKKDLQSFRQTSEGKSALVLANGPSINNLDLGTAQKLQSEGRLDTFVINFFLKTALAKKVRADFLILSDPLTHPDSTDSRNVELWQLIAPQNDLTLVVPASWSRAMQRLALPNAVLYFNDRGLESWSHNIKPTRARGYLSLTGLKALAMACYGSYERICISGFDNSMFQTIRVDASNNLMQGENHASGAGHGAAVSLNSQYPKGLGDYFYAYSVALLHFRLFAKDKRILNLDPDSFTDAFPKDANGLA